MYVSYFIVSHLLFEVENGFDMDAKPVENVEADYYESLTHNYYRMQQNRYDWATEQPYLCT